MLLGCPPAADVPSPASAPGASIGAMTTDESPSSDNEVFLRGRLADAAEIRTLPSGDELCVFRITVPRPPGERARVDSIDCATSAARARKAVLAAEAGQVVEVRGCLRRRFWRGGAGLASRYEVQVAAAKVIRRRSDA
jgi:single-strand DNA-binding protein